MALEQGPGKKSSAVIQELQARLAEAEATLLAIRSGQSDDPHHGHTVTLTDIAERERAEEALRESEALRRAVMDYSTDAIYVKDHTSRWLLANPALLRIVGKPLEAVLGQTDAEIYADAAIGAAILANDVQVMERGEPVVFEEQAETPAGLRLFQSIKAPTRNTEGQVTGLIGISRDITERVRAQEALRESEERFRQLAEASFEGLVIHDAGLMLDVNSRITDMLGYDPASLIGKPFWEFIVPEYHALVRKQVGNQTREPYQVELFHADGRRVPVEVMGRAIPWKGREVRAVALRDLTARKRAEEELRENERLLREFLEHLPAGAALMDTQGQIQVSNEAYRRVVPERIPSHDPEGRKRWRTWDAEGRLVEPGDWPGARALRGESIVPGIEFLFTAADGREVWHRVSAIPFRGASGEIVGAISVIQDIDAVKQAEQEREGLLQREQAARQQAEAATKLRDQFISVASHELRTPLTGIKGYAELLVQRGEQEHLDASFQRMAATINVQVGRLDRMITALLDISRIERGQLSIEREPVNLSMLIDSIIEDTKPTLRKHTLEFMTVAEPLVVQGDEMRLEQVLQNLIQNAIKYSPLGGPVSVELSREGDTARVAVTDRGMGIPRESLPQIFDRFYRAPNAEANHINGLGVGLYVAQEIVHLHGGEVQVESQEGQGSTFTVSLPLSQN